MKLLLLDFLSLPQIDSMKEPADMLTAKQFMYPIVIY